MPTNRTLAGTEAWPEGGVDQRGVAAVVDCVDPVSKIKTPVATNRIVAAVMAAIPAGLFARDQVWIDPLICPKPLLLPTPIRWSAFGDLCCVLGGPFPQLVLMP
jgi:hypothetical protein